MSNEFKPVVREPTAVFISNNKVREFIHLNSWVTWKIVGGELTNKHLWRAADWTLTLRLSWWNKRGHEYDELLECEAWLSSKPLPAMTKINIS